MDTDTKEALQGIKIADFSWVLAGPAAIRYLAAHGATVVRVESTLRPDTLRTSGPYKDGRPGVDRSGYFAFFNTNKYSIRINLNNEAGREVARRLIAWADIVAENFVPGLMERWGLGYEEIKKIRPDVIMLRTSNQGQTGSQAKQPGFGQHLVGLSGFSYYTGWPDREPIGFGLAYTDMITPRFAAASLLAALEYRRRTGKGLLLDISQLETALHFLAPQILDYTVNGRTGGRTGNRSDAAAPHGAYPCRDEDSWCTIAVFTDKEWDSFANMVNEPWVKDPRFNTFLGRKKYEDDLEKLVSQWTVKFDAEHLMKRLQDAGIPAGVTQNNEEVLNDPQLRHRGSFWTLEHSELGTYVHLGQPFKLSKTPAKPRMPSPCLGEHTEYVCTSILGMSDEEFTGFMASGVFD